MDFSKCEVGLKKTIDTQRPLQALGLLSPACLIKAIKAARAEYGRALKSGLTENDMKDIIQEAANSPYTLGDIIDREIAKRG